MRLVMLWPTPRTSGVVTLRSVVGYRWDPAGNNYLNGFTCSTDFSYTSIHSAGECRRCDASEQSLIRLAMRCIFDLPGWKRRLRRLLWGPLWTRPATSTLRGDVSSDFPTVNPIQPLMLAT